MKKHLQILTLLAAMLLPWTMWGQGNTLTVADGTSQNQYLPVYSYYMDNLMRTQCIYPDDSLTALRGMAITELKFYSAYNQTFTGTTELSLGITSATSLSSGWATESLQTVWTGHVSISNHEMVITLDAPFEYPATGGNLLVQFWNTQSGNCGSSSDKFYGVSMTGAARYLNYAGGSPVGQDFLPKCTFTYASVTCPAPSLLAVNNIEARSADISFYSTASSWVLHINPAIDGVSDFELYDTTYTITDLTPETHYSISVRSVCGGVDTSYAVPTSFTTPVSCPPVSGFSIPAMTTTTATIAWNAGGEETEWVGTINPAVDEVSEWYSSDTTISFEDLTPETNYTLTVRAVCGPEDTSAVRTFHFYTGYCQPYPSSADGDGITNVTFGLGDSIVNNSNRPYSDPYYGNYYNLVGQAPAGLDLAVDITYATGYTYGTIIWVDWNNNLNFDGDEVVYVGESANSNPTTLHASFRVPDTMPLGNYRMRIAGADMNFDSYTSSIAAAANADPCFSASYAVAHDYTLQVTEAPSCLPVNDLTVAYVSADSVTLTWSAAGTENEWIITVGGEEYNAYDTTYTFEELNPNTVYNFSVRAVCGGGDTSAASNVSTRTTCGEFGPMPYSENFSGYGYAEWVNCWTRVTTGSGYPYTTDSYGNSVMFGGGAAAISPRVPAPVNSIVVSFDLQKEGSSSGSMEFGYTTNPNSVDSMVVLHSINPASEDVYINYEFDLSIDTNLTNVTDSVYLVWRQNGASNWYYWLDNVTIEPANSCTKPDQFVCTTTANPDSIVVTWNEIGSATSWQLFVAPTGVAPSEDAELIDVTDMTYTFTGLTGGVVYDIYVRSDCGGDYSNWRGPLAVAPGSVNMPSSGSRTVTGCGFVIYDDGGADAGYSNYADGTLIIYPSAPDSLIRLYGHFHGESCCDYLTILDGAGLGGTQLHYGIGYGATATIDTLVSTTGPLTIHFTSDVSGCGDGDLVLYVNCVAAPECGHVENVSIEAGVSTALAVWTPSIIGNYSGADIEYKEAVDTTWTALTTTDSYVALTGLTPNTLYDFRVAAICDGVNSAWESVQFTTGDFECLQMDPSTVRFDTIVGTSATTSYNIPVNNYYHNTFSEQLYTATELDSAGTINGFSLNYAYTSPMTAKNNCEVYMANTTLSSITTTSYVQPENMTLVYSGPLNCSNGWNHFDFNEGTFSYSGGNLVVAVIDNSDAYNSSSYVWSCHSATGRAMSWYSDSYFYPNNSMNKTTHSFVPDMVFSFGDCAQQRTCVRPVAQVANVTTNSAELVWAPGNVETSWSVAARRVGETNYTYYGTTTNTNFTFTGLNSGSNYEFMVTAQCGSDSNSAVVTATTQCAMISSLPFTENFNSWGTGVIPNCWYKTGSYSTYGVISNTYNHSGATGGAIYTYASSGASYTTYTILPELDTNIYQANQLQLDFAGYRDYDGYVCDYAVGVMTDPNDISSFVPVDTIHITNLESWQMFEVPLDSYTGNGAYVAVKSVYLGSYGYGYLDDFVLETIPTCPRPDSLMAANATSSTVDLSWHERGSASEWVVEYGPVGFQLGTGTTVTATSNPFTLTGLPASYDGEYYVRSVCSSTDSGQYSYLSCRFATSQIPAAIPYNYNFEDAAEWANWQTNSNSDINWYRGNADAGDGSYSMYISADSGATVGNNVFSSTVNASAFRDIDFGTVDSSFTFTFKAKVGGTTTAAYDALMVFLVDPSVPVVAPTANITSPWGSVNDLYRIATVRVDTTWNTYTASFDNISGVHRVAFFWFNQNTASSQPFIGGPAEVDSISIDYSACPRPTELELVSAGASSATVTWRGPASASYEIVYRPYPNGTANTTVYSNTNSYTFSGLESLTQYAFWVRKICGTDSSLYSDGELFTTALCDGAVYAYNYDSTSTFTTTDYIPAYAYYNYGASQTIIDSADLAVLDGAEISAFAFTTNSGTNGEYYTDCEVYLMHTTMNEFTSEDPVDLDSAVLVYQGDLTFSDAGVQMFGFDTTFVWDGHSNVILTILRHHGSYGSSSSYVFEAVEKSSDKGLYAYSDSYDPVAPSLTSYSGYFYTTNVVAAYQLIACGAGCPTPVIVSTIPTYNSAAITWSSNATNFEVSYKSVSDADFTTPVAVAATNYDLTGLTPATQYTVRVRSLCDSGAVSDWASVNFVTDSLPCFAPEDLHQTALTYTTVTLDWTNGGNEQNWVVKVFNSRIGEILDTVSAHPATISGLTANEQYFATVQAACGNNLDGFSDWSDTISFTTTECVAVSNISCATPTNSSVEITWTSNGSESAWIVEYGMPGFGQGEEMGRATATTNPYQLSLAGLEPNTTYEVYVYAQCMEGLTSVPAGPASFTTNDIGISGISGNADINIYPNPTTGSTTISVSGISGKVNVAIVDMNGREVMSSAMECDGDCEKVMNVEGLAQGAYFVRIYGEEINSIRKLIVR